MAKAELQSIGRLVGWLPSQLANICSAPIYPSGQNSLAIQFDLIRWFTIWLAKWAKGRFVSQLN